MNQLFSNCASFKNLDKALINKWGDISVLLPAQEQQLDNLLKHPKFVEDEQKAIGAILEFYRLCVALNRETLEIRYKGKSISDVLNMTINEGVDFFEHIPKIYRKLNLRVTTYLSTAMNAIV